MSQFEVWRIQEFHGSCVQYVNQVLALDLIRAAMSGCRVCSMEVLAGFHFLVHRFEGFPFIFIIASWHTQLTASGSYSDVKLYNFVDCHSQWCL